MKNKKIVIAGGTGFIGEEIIRYFKNDNEIIILSRKIETSVTNSNKETILSSKDATRIKLVKWDGVHLGEWTKK
jgi:NAD dependent epimerase/dehydratase family enzyme